MEEVQAAKEQGKHLELLKPLDQIFSQYPRITLAEAEAFRCKNGTDIRKPALGNGTYRVYGPQGEFLMLGECADGILRTVKSFFEVN